MAMCLDAYRLPFQDNILIGKVRYARLDGLGLPGIIDLDCASIRAWRQRYIPKYMDSTRAVPCRPEFGRVRIPTPWPEVFCIGFGQF